ncbi:MAG TPA: peroxidase family protein [Pyrinomonadaceae bacterium]|jgi:hypothetical protein|nr:peroxidase family protein [Pyrinomonadaceae bacterium]
MRRFAHGSSLDLNHASLSPVGLEIEAENTTAYRYLFNNLQKDSSLLPESNKTVLDLEELGSTMQDKEQSSKFNSNIPSAYTYFGQFVDHDISWSLNLPDSCALQKEDIKPWSTKEVLSIVRNRRSEVLELESIYGDGAAKDDTGFVLAEVSDSDFPIKVADKLHDLVRSEPNSDGNLDRSAQIPDPRNDTNLIVSQMHVAFLRAHNEIMRRKNCSFGQAQVYLTQHYHWVIIDDFLNRIADPVQIGKAMSAPLYKPTIDGFSLPLEFTVAAYRFGHAMIRNTYYLNSNYPGVGLLSIFVLNVLSDSREPTFGKGFRQIPAKRIVEWKFFIKNILNLNLAQKIRTQMADPLFKLLGNTDLPMPCERRLAVQDLKRGYMLRMPTGQAIADELDCTKLTAKQIKDYSTPEQAKILEASGFDKETPLWYYILVEAAEQGGGNRLGEVGSRIVAEVLIGLVRKSPNSFFNIPHYFPEFADKGQFKLADLLTLAGVLSKFP